MHALIENGAVSKYPYTVAQLRQAHPSTSFPKNPSDESLAEFGVLRVFNTTPPEYDAMTQTLEEATPVFDATDARWVQVWVVRDLTEEEIQTRTESQAQSVRADRNSRLAGCDWTQGKDIPDVVSVPWAVYRQALRDVPEQAGFPWDIEWPEQP
jgi:hypothetical protein